MFVLIHLQTRVFSLTGSRRLNNRPPHHGILRDVRRPHHPARQIGGSGQAGHSSLVGGYARRRCRSATRLRCHGSIPIGVAAPLCEWQHCFTSCFTSGGIAFQSGALLQHEPDSSMNSSTAYERLLVFGSGRRAEENGPLSDQTILGIMCSVLTFLHF